MNRERTNKKAAKAGLADFDGNPPANFCVNCEHHRRSWWRHVCVKPEWVGTDHNPVTGKPFNVKHVMCSQMNSYAWCDGFEAKS